MNAISRVLVRTVRLGIGFGLVLAALSASAMAIPPSAPEIDPGSMASAVALLTSGMLMLSERKRRR
jgi:hypothetical protein